MAEVCEFSLNYAVMFSLRRGTRILVHDVEIFVPQKHLFIRIFKSEVENFFRGTECLFETILDASNEQKTNMIMIILTESKCVFVRLYVLKLYLL